jgi:hypothetical protein
VPDCSDGGEGRNRAPEEGGAAKKKKKRKKKKKKKKSGPAEAVCLYPGGQLFDIVQGGGSGDADSGRRAVTKVGRIDAGTLVLDEEPYGFIVTSANARKYCAACCALVQRGPGGQPPLEPSPTKGPDASAYEGGVVPGTTTETGGVKLAVYCSAACKAQHAPLYALQEPCLAKLRPVCVKHRADPDLLRFVIHLACERVLAVRRQQQQQQQQSEEGAAGSSSGGSAADVAWQQVQALVAHPPSSDDWTMAVRGALGDLLPHLPPTVGADCFRAAAEGHGREGQQEQAVLDGLVGLGLRINSNSHGMRDLEGRNANVGIGLFPTFAMFNHSCAPNCVFAFSPSRRCMEVRAIEDVDARDGGTELCVSYIDLYQPTGVRREELKQTKHFLCACPRCDGKLMGSEPPAAAFCKAVSSSSSSSSSNSSGDNAVGLGRFGAADHFLDGLCCSVCCRQQGGKNGVSMEDPTPTLLRPFPCSPEQIQKNQRQRQQQQESSQSSTLSAQEEEDALVAAFDDLNGAKASVNSPKKSKAQLKKEAAAAKAKAKAAAAANAPPPAPQQQQQQQEEGNGESAPPSVEEQHQHPPGSLHCHCCGAMYTEHSVMAASRDATVMLGSVGPLLSQRNYSEARNILDELLEQCVATGGSGASGSSDARSQQGSFRYGLSKRPMLHPMHTVAFNAHAQLVNCCRSAGDHGDAVKHLRQIVSSFDAVFPANYPEAADYLFAYVGREVSRKIRSTLIFTCLSHFCFYQISVISSRFAETIRNYSASNGRLPRRVLDALRTEMKEAAKRCLTMREVCFGADSPITKEAESLARAAARG